MHSFFIYSYIHTLFGPFFPLPPNPTPTPSFLPHPPHFLFSNFVEEKTEAIIRKT
jgi:hypothetical protein